MSRLWPEAAMAAFTRSLAAALPCQGALVSVAVLQSAGHDRNELRGCFCRAAFPGLESGPMHTLAKFVVSYARGGRVELCDLLVVDGVDGVGPVGALRDGIGFPATRRSRAGPAHFP